MHIPNYYRTDYTLKQHYFKQLEKYNRRVKLTKNINAYSKKINNNWDKKAVVGFIEQLPECIYKVRYDKLCDLIKGVIKKQSPHFRWTARLDRFVIFSIPHKERWSEKNIKHYLTGN